MLIRNATVLTMDPALGDLTGADVSLEGDRIAAIGPGLAAAPGEDVLDATGCIVIPGFVDTHRHMWEGLLRGFAPGGTITDYFRRVVDGVGPHLSPADLALSEALSARAALDAGVTTVQDTADIHDHPDCTDAIVAALQASGLRTVLAYDSSGPYARRHGSSVPADVRRVRSELLPDDSALVTLALGTRAGEDDAERHNARLARELGLRTARHVRAEIPPSRLAALDALLPGTTYVHANGLGPDEFALMADSGGSVSIAPVVELSMRLGHPVVAESLAAGLPISVSVDVETTSSADLFAQLRALHLAGRAVDAPVSVRDLLAWATVGGAQALGLGDRVGSLTPGRQADLVVLRADGVGVVPVLDPAATVVLQLDRAHVDTVLVAGRVRKRGGRMVDDDGPLLERAAAAAARLRSAGVLAGVLAG